MQHPPREERPVISVSVQTLAGAMLVSSTVRDDCALGRSRLNANIPGWVASSAGTGDIGPFLAQAFPGYMVVDAAAVVDVVPHANPPGAGQVGPVLVGDAELSLPYRIYSDEPAERLLAGLTATQRLLVRAFYTRHHDGRIRERNLDQVIGSSEPWIVPYVVQLVGEYVVEIIESVARGLQN
jgi:hypothetical protein